MHGQLPLIGKWPQLAAFGFLRADLVLLLCVYFSPSHLPLKNMALTDNFLQGNSSHSTCDIVAMVTTFDGIVITIIKGNFYHQDVACPL